MAEELISRLCNLYPDQTVYVDFHDTLYYPSTDTANIALIQALKIAQANGAKIHLWTAAPFQETVQRVEQMRLYGLEFDDVHCEIAKGDIIIDNLAYPPE